MTESEAIEGLGILNNGLNEAFVNADELSVALQMAIQALEKQIPKKPTYDGDGYAPDGTFVWDEWLCPCCGERYEVDYDDYDYCPNCGQKLDWSDENEID